jgi:hypothetical protein
MTKNAILAREFSQVCNSRVITPLFQHYYRIFVAPEGLTNSNNSCILQVLSEQIFWPTHTPSRPCIESIAPETMNENDAKFRSLVLYRRGPCITMTVKATGEFQDVTDGNMSNKLLSIFLDCFLNKKMR